MESHKQLSDLVILEKLKNQKNQNCSFSCQIHKTQKKIKLEADAIDPTPKYQHTWYLKRSPYLPEYIADAELDCFREVIAQELLRLLNPAYPKTRLVKSDLPYFRHVISKEIPGFQLLSNIVPFAKLENKIINQKYRMLGFAAIAALFVNEIDFKLANLGVSSEGEIIKIDGGRSFMDFDKDRWEDARIRLANYNITAKDLNLCPKIKNYQAYTWLDEFRFSYYFLADHLPENLPSIRAEINEAILKIILLPDELINDFVKHYLDSEKYQQIFYQEICKRRNMFRAEAIKLESFRNYLQSDQANKLLTSFIQSLQEFKLTKKTKLDMPRFEPIITSFYEVYLKNTTPTVEKETTSPSKSRGL